MSKSQLELTNLEVQQLMHGPALANLLQKENVPAKTKYWCYRFVKKLSAISQDVERVRKDIVVKYASRDEAGKPKIDEKKKIYLFDGDNESLATQEINDMLKEKNLLNMDRIKIDLDNFPEGLISTNDMLGLDTIIDFSGSLPEG